MQRTLLTLLSATVAFTAASALAGDDTSLVDRPRTDYPFQLEPTHPQADPAAPIWISDPDTIEEPRPIMVAGSLSGSPSDSPSTRVDANVASSPWSGVASISIGGSFICTATPISRRHLVSAGHCVDSNSNGTNDFGTNIEVIFNRTGAQSMTISPSGIQSVDVHPDYTGFGNPALNDDIIVITLVDELPPEIPIYPPYRGSLSSNEIITFIGYGRSGAGDLGYTTNASFSTKRVGANALSRFFQDDEPGGTLVELYQFDFDGPTGGGPYGGETLGNDIETTFGGGDSGGPGMIDVTGEGDYQIYTVNTFVSNNGGTAAPFFGSSAGGVVITGYLDWLDQFLSQLCQLPEDLTGDNFVDSKDLAIMLGAWGTDDPIADVSGNGIVDSTDVAVLLGGWHRSCD